MTSYSNFVQDFPNRCMELLDAFMEEAVLRDKEVTLMLTIAMAAFIIPFERLRPSQRNHVAQDRHEDLVNELKSLLSKSFILWHGGMNIEIINNLDGDTIRENQVDYWANPSFRKSLDQSINVEFVLSLIRNALSHGNIFTFPRSNTYQKTNIESLIFLSKIQDKVTKELLDRYKVIITSPKEFLQILRLWMKFIYSLKMPVSIHQDAYIELPEYIYLD